MGAIYRLSFSALASGTVASTFKSLLGLKAANTAGHRGRLRSLAIGPAGEAPQDLDVALRIAKTDNTTDGTATALTPQKVDSGSIASVMTGNSNYTVEPTTVSVDVPFEIGLNSRGALIKEWGPDDGPRWGPSETLLVQVAPGTAAAVKLSGTLVWEEY